MGGHRRRQRVNRRHGAVANAWPAADKATLRVVSEPKLGLAFARARGIDEARGEIISFVDDDNWLCRTWVQTVCDVMRSHPEVAALGGIIEPAFETTRPALVRAGRVSLCHRSGRRAIRRRHGRPHAVWRRAERAAGRHWPI